MSDDVHELRTEAAQARRALRDADAQIVDLSRREDVREWEGRVTAPAARAAATAKWAFRAGLHRLAPPFARRLFTVHYACLCLPAGEHDHD